MVVSLKQQRTRDVAKGYPDGLAERHAGHGRLLDRHANPLSFVVLGGILLIALLGLLGGGRSPVVRATAPAAVLTVKTPHTLRSGLFFETVVTVEATAPIADAVIAVPAALWRDQTINTQTPAPEKEEARDGTFRFHYGPLEAGERLDVKIDGQVNPPLTIGTSGAVVLLDGEREIARAPLTIRVLP